MPIGALVRCRVVLVKRLPQLPAVAHASWDTPGGHLAVGASRGRPGTCSQCCRSGFEGAWGRGHVRCDLCAASGPANGPGPLLDTTRASSKAERTALLSQGNIPRARTTYLYLLEKRGMGTFGMPQKKMCTGLQQRSVFSRDLLISSLSSP